MRKATWEMDSTELARVVAAHNGWKGEQGGFIRDTDGLPIVQGYWTLGEILQEMEIIEPGVGVHWRRQSIRALAKSNHPTDISLELARRVRARFARQRGWTNFARRTA